MATHRLALALLVLLCALLLPPPAPATAQSFPCRHQENLLPLLTPLTGTYKAEGRVVIEGVTLTLVFCAPKSHGVVADQMLALAVKALPVLERLTDVKLDGAHRREFFLDEGKLLRELGADGAIDADNRVFLHTGSLESTLVHELAHYWADRDRFKEPWMVEAYAEYLTALAVAELRAAGETISTPPQQPTPTGCAGLPLVQWRPAMRDIELCPYTVGEQVFHELAHLAGPATFQRVVGELSSNPSGFNSARLHFELERASGANLSPVLRGRVFGPEFNETLDARAALHERYQGTARLAGNIGASLPPALLEKLKLWVKDTEVQAELDRVEPLLGGAVVVHNRCAELALSCVRPWEQSIADEGTWPALEQFLAWTPQILSTFEELRNRVADLGLALPEALRVQTGQLNAASLQALQSATNVLASAVAYEEHCTRLGIKGCRESWRPFWESGDLEAILPHIEGFTTLFEAGQALEARCGEPLQTRCRQLWMETMGKRGPSSAQALIGDLDALLVAGAAVERACARLGPRCRELWQRALLQESPASAQAVILQLEQLFTAGTALEARCNSVGASCAQLWQRELSSRSVAAADGMIKGVDGLLHHGEQVEHACRTAGWPCPTGWRAALRTGDLDEAHDLLERQETALPELERISELVANEGCCGSFRPDHLGLSVGDPLATARSAFNSGDVANAKALANEALTQQIWQRQILLAVLVLGTLVVAGIVAALLSALLRRRARPTSGRAPAASRAVRSTAPAPTGQEPPAAPGAHSELLGAMLGKPPERPKP